MTESIESRRRSNIYRSLGEANRSQVLSLQLPQPNRLECRAPERSWPLSMKMLGRDRFARIRASRARLEPSASDPKPENPASDKLSGGASAWSSFLMRTGGRESEEGAHRRTDIACAAPG